MSDEWLLIYQNLNLDSDHYRDFNSLYRRNTTENDLVKKNNPVYQ
jgi:hypothetical protein